MNNWKFYIETFGCKINQYESELIKENWIRQGGYESDDPSQADYILINSCAITSTAERDARNAVYRYKDRSNAKIILCGCSSQLFDKKKPLQKEVQPDAIVSNQQKNILFNHPEIIFSKNLQLIDSHYLTEIQNFARSRPVVKIQDGCSHFCSYCIVPYTRGKAVSRPFENILNECKNLIKNGFFELIISGINLFQYGKTGNERIDFWDMIKGLCINLRKEFPKQFRLRISSIDPGLITIKGLRVLQENPEICPHLHLSIQHSSPRILDAMNRSHYSADFIIEIIQQLKKFWPIFGLGADFMTGFPGETETDVRHLLNFIEKINFSYGHVFPFSARPGTPAASMEMQIENKDKKKRAYLIRKKLEEKKNIFLQKNLNLEKMTIVREEKNYPIHGMNEYYIMCYVANPEQIVSDKRNFTVIPKEIKNKKIYVNII